MALAVPTRGRRLLAAVGGLVVSLVVAAVVLRLGTDEPAGWRTVTVENEAAAGDRSATRVLVEVPAAWVADDDDCDDDVITRATWCLDHVSVFYGQYRTEDGPGLRRDGDGWRGYVGVDVGYVDVHGDDEAALRRVLASARAAAADPN